MHFLRPLNGIEEKPYTSQHQFLKGQPVLGACCRTNVGGSHITDFLRLLLSLKYPYHALHNMSTSMAVIVFKRGPAHALHLTPNRKQKIPILHNVSGIIKPHRMTLLLGPPGAGKT